MNVYIACGLTHVPREEFSTYVSLIHEIAKQLRNMGDVTVRYALQDSDPQLATKPHEQRSRLCYLWDRAMVEWADVVVAESTYPSTGMGIELQIAEGRGTPIVICFNGAQKNKAMPVEYDNPNDSHHMLQIGQGYVSLMALGIPTVFKVICYSRQSDCTHQICDAVALVRRDVLMQSINPKAAAARKPGALNCARIGVAENRNKGSTHEHRPPNRLRKR